MRRDQAESRTLGNILVSTKLQLNTGKGKKRELLFIINRIIKLL